MLSYYWSITLNQWLTRAVWKGYQPNYYIHNGMGYVKDVQNNHTINKTIIYFHGTNGNVYNSVQRLSRLDADIYYIEYSGYSEFSSHSDFDSNTLMNHIKDIIGNILEDIPTDRELILYGRSIGSGVLFENIDMFKYSKHKIHGIILETPFKDLHKAISSYLPYYISSIFCYTTGWNLEVEKYVLNNIKWFKTNNIKFMLIAGENDRITPEKDILDIAKVLEKNNITVQMHTFTDMGHDIPFEGIMKLIYNWIN